MSVGTALNAVIEAGATLHLLRPHGLWALLALPLLAGLWQLRRRRASVWRQAVDPHLLPHLIDGRVEARRNTALWLGVLGYLLAVLALAGPSWRQIEQPLWQTRTPLVIALDLSSASLAGDLPPSRLAQARAKIASLLEARQGGQVGLVVYAGDAFTVAPLTEDAANAMLKAIEEPPPRGVLLISAPSAVDLLPTIRSRCRLASLRTPSAEAVARVLELRARRASPG
ncbi:MAG: VWA domain-containing protein [Proteobacteria bacterium]|nr:VWA domain-containing protein [Pseudomonadota bacterium]